jgi:hypothetical protein
MKLKKWTIPLYKNVWFVKFDKMDKTNLHNKNVTFVKFDINNLTNLHID